MTAREIIDRIQRTPLGGVTFDESRWDYAYLKSLLNTYRGKVISRAYTGDRYLAANPRINNSCYQAFYPEYSSNLQEDNCYNIFIVPSVITVDRHSDGFRYVGKIDGTRGFNRIKDGADLSNQMKLSKFNPLDRTFISYLYDGYYLKVYGQDVRNFKVEGVFQNPFEIPTFNEFVDDYPINDDHVDMIEQLILREQTAIETSKPADTVSDSAETPIRK